jgi:hypothetical protein
MQEEANVILSYWLRNKAAEEALQELHGHAWFMDTRKYLLRAEQQDLEAIQWLSWPTPGWHIGLFIRWLHFADFPPVCLRTALAEAWSMRHREVIWAAGTRNGMRALFRAARFDTSMLPETVTIWRGTSGLSRQEAARGWSWSTRRSTAAWFALRHAGQRVPLVLQRTVPRTDIMHFSDDRDEAECVLSKIGPCKVDGDLEEWRRLYEEEVERRRNPMASLA